MPPLIKFHYSQCHLFFTLLVCTLTLISCKETRILAEVSADRFSAKQRGLYSDIDNNIHVGYGFNAGLLAEIKPDAFTFKNNASQSSKQKTGFSIVTGLLFIQKGYIRKFAPGYKTSFTLNYAELPVCVNYFHSVGNGSLFGGIGAYFAEGIGGQTKFYAPGTYSNYMSFGKIVSVKRFDAGLNFQLGYEFNNSFSIAFAYDFGLKNIIPAGEREMYNRTMCLNVRYNLSRFLKHSGK